MPFQKARPSQWKEAQPIKANVPSSSGTGSSMAKCHKVNQYLNIEAVEDRDVTFN